MVEHTSLPLDKFPKLHNNDMMHDTASIHVCIILYHCITRAIWCIIMALRMTTARQRAVLLRPSYHCHN